jgi:hypothetical protein
MQSNERHVAGMRLFAVLWTYYTALATFVLAVAARPCPCTGRYPNLSCNAVWQWLISASMAFLFAPGLI